MVILVVGASCEPIWESGATTVLIAAGSNRSLFTKDDNVRRLSHARVAYGSFRPPTTQEENEVPE